MQPSRWIDLHMHSTASDGAFDPSTLMRLAAERGLAAVALTDHDTVAGLAAAAAAAAAAGIEFISGVELNTRFFDRPVHLLGYGFDPSDAALLAALKRVRGWRAERNARILARLDELGLHVALDPAGAVDGAAVGRPHIADELVRAGAAPDRRAAFTRYLGVGGAAYVRRESLSPGEAIGLVRGAGGVVSAAHPVQIRTGSRSELETLIRRLTDLGLQAIEVYHPDHAPRDTRNFVELARRCGLALTGGSDFHGLPGRPPPRPGIGFAGVRVPHDCLVELKACIGSAAAR